MDAIVAQTNEQLQLSLFGSADRLPRRPYCTSDLSKGLRIRSLAQALKKPYIHLNPWSLNLKPFLLAIGYEFSVWRHG
jgi:hypothetical protein